MTYTNFEIKLPTDYSENDIELKIKKRFKLNDFNFVIEKKSLDARKKDNIHWVIKVGIFSEELKQRKENGISKFMQKLGTGYTMYFNQKYERVGGLFQGKFKAVSVDEDSHFIHLPYYIHSNPIELFNERGRTSLIDKMKFLENYKWSSFPDYVGKKNFPSVTQREFLLDFFNGAEKYKKETKEWLKDIPKNSEKIKEITLG